MPDRLRELLAPLGDRTLRRLVGSFLVNELGDGISVALLPLVVAEGSGLGVVVGATFAINRVVSVVGRPVGGILADRLDRHRVLRVTFVIRGALLAVALALADSTVAVAVCLVTAGFVGTIDNASGEAAIRERAGDALRQVATIRKFSHALSGVLGMTVAALLLGLVDLRAALAADLVTYVVALVVLPAGPAASWRRRSRAVTGAPRSWSTSVANAWRSSLVDAREGIGHLAGHRDLRIMVAGLTIMAGLVTALLTTAALWFAQRDISARYALALAAYSVGSLVGLVASGLVVWRVSVPRVVWRTLVGCGVICALGAVAGDWRVLAGSWAAWGLAMAPMEVVTDTRLVQLTPERLLGRSYAGLATLAALGQVAGGVLGGAVADAVPTGRVIVGLGVVMAVAGLSMWAWTARVSPPAGVG